MKQYTEPIRSGSLVLRLVTDADLAMTRQWRNRDEARVWFKNSNKLTETQHQDWFAKYLTNDNDYFFIVEADGVPVGQASVYEINWSKGTAEVGRFLAAPDFAGRGYLTKACQVLLSFCRTTLGLDSVYLEVFETNEKAIRLYQRCGFFEERRYDGLIRMGMRWPESGFGGRA